MAKQVIVMRKDLNMRKGKMCAQAGHASLAAFFKVCSVKATRGGRTYNVVDDDALDWLEQGFTKICVYVNSEQELLDIFQKADTAGLPVALIKDAGHTEFGGVPTLTCCGIGPADESAIDAITGKLPLL